MLSEFLSVNVEVPEYRAALPDVHGWVYAIGACARASRGRTRLTRRASAQQHVYGAVRGCAAHRAADDRHVCTPRAPAKRERRRALTRAPAQDEAGALQQEHVQQVASAAPPALLQVLTYARSITQCFCARC